MTANVEKKGLNRIRIKSWRHYSRERLQRELHEVNWDQFQHLNANAHSNRLEEVLTKIHDKLVPEVVLRREEEKYAWSEKIIALKRRKKNLLRKARRQGRPELHDRIKEIDKSIWVCFKEETKKKIRRTLGSHDPKVFWRAVGSAQGYEHGNIPQTMKLNGRKITLNAEKASEFMNTFTSKVASVRESTRVDPAVYNGHREIFSDERNFFEENLICQVVKELRSRLARTEFR
jgi:hypothetical protein